MPKIRLNFFSINSGKPKIWPQKRLVTLEITRPEIIFWRGHFVGYLRHNHLGYCKKLLKPFMAHPVWTGDHTAQLPQSTTAKAAENKVKTGSQAIHPQHGSIYILTQVKVYLYFKRSSNSVTNYSWFICTVYLHVQVFPKKMSNIFFQGAATNYF